MPEETPITPKLPSPPPSEQQPPRRYRWWPWVIGLLLVLLAGGVFFQRQRASQSRSKGPPTPPALPVTTMTAQKGDIGIYVNALGAVTPVNTVAVKSRVDGQLMRVNYREGQMASAGDLLLEIDPKPFQ